MSKVSLVQRNLKRKKLIDKFSTKRNALRSIVIDTSATPEERLSAVLRLSKLPRNSSPTRYRLRCELTGRPRGNYRKFALSRNKFRELASKGIIPGVTKSSW